jgi:protein involved in polysaccharide export with SLBB domain
MLRRLLVAALRRGTLAAGLGTLLAGSAGVPSAWGFAQNPAAQPQGAYVFVPGDVLEISVQPQQGYDRTLTIQPDGKIVYPVVGELTAAGMTITQLTERLQHGLEAELKRPRVTVSLKEANKAAVRRVSVLGAVRTPGAFDLKEGSTLAEMLATAGGPTPIADLRRITITRAECAAPTPLRGVPPPPAGKKLLADLSGAAHTGEVDENFTLEPGDLIIVPEGPPPTVLVLGEVVKPGSYELQGEMRLMDALSQAGGPTTHADLRRVTLTRAGEKEKEVFDLQELLTQGQPDGEKVNILLRPGDTLLLPESERKFYVLGEVNKSEAYPLKPNTRLLDAIVTAGGSTREADLTKVTLLRKGDKNQPVAREVNLKAMMQKGDTALNEPLREGDVVFVPSRKQKRPITDYLGIIYPLASLATLFR